MRDTELNQDLLDALFPGLTSHFPVIPHEDAENHITKYTESDKELF